MVDRVKIFLTPSLIIVRNLFKFLLLYERMSEVLELWGTLGPTPWDTVVVGALETRYFPTCVNVPNVVALGQTVLGVGRVPKIEGI